MTNIKNRLSQGAWLEKALEILANEGEKKLSIVHLAKLMGVTKGSFYWHFKNRKDFTETLIHY
jgi:AcrR family transcriptional regulator